MLRWFIFLVLIRLQIAGWNGIWCNVLETLGIFMLSVPCIICKSCLEESNIL